MSNNIIKKGLNISERLILDSILPKEGKFEELILVKDIKDKIKFTKDELEKYKIKTTSNGIEWNIEKEKEDFNYDFDIDDIKLIQSNLKKLSDEGKLTLNHISLYKKFI